MDQRDAGTATGLLNEIHLFSEAQLGFRKPKIMSDQHVILSAEDVLPHQYADTAASCDKVEEPVVATKEIELQSIRNLLPDEDDLFSGIIDKLRCSSHSDGSEEEEDFDLFCSGGGMELEVDNCLNPCQENSNNTNGISNGGRSSNVSIASKHPYGEHPSRTLFVRNINSYLEDSELRSLFEQYGDIQTVYSACKHRGFVIISYYDIRAAWSAMNSLQNKPVRSRNLDIHYTIPKDNLPEKDINLGTLVVFNHDSLVSNDELRQIFGTFGEIKEIGKTLQYQRFIEFYDIRAAEAAYCALNRNNIAGKQIKLELSHPGGERQCSMQEFSPVLAQDECSLCGSLTDTSSSEPIANVPSAPLITSCIYGGTVCGLHTKSGMNGSGFNENAFSQGSFSVPNSFPVRVATICNQFGLRESRHSLDQGKSGNQCTPSYHLHSLLENYDGSTNEVPYDPFSTVANLAIDVGPRILEGMNDRHIYITDSCQQVERYEGVFGTSWTSGFPIHGNHYVERLSNSFQHLPASPLVWRNSSPFVNGIHAHCTPKQPGLSRSSAHVLNTVLHMHDMLNTVSHTQQCRNGSAPAANLTCWNSEHACMAKYSEVGFHMESFGRVGFHRRSSALASHNFLHEDHIDTFLNSALSSPQRTCQNFSRVNLVSSAPTSFCTPKERMKNLSNCRSEADSCHAEKIMYELDIDRVLRREDSRTTLMIKNIPNKYTSKMLLATIDEQHRGTYDFIYLPIDFKNKCNMGYAFINMIDPLQIVPFYKTFNGKKWEKFNGGKVASLAYARIQGKAALVGHFQNSSLMNEDKRCRPILFCTDGPNAGDQEPFPLGPSIRSRSSKSRSSFNEEYHNQASPSSFVRRQLISSGTNSLSGSMKDSNFEQTTNQMHQLL